VNHSGRPEPRSVRESGPPTGPEKPVQQQRVAPPAGAARSKVSPLKRVWIGLLTLVIAFVGLQLLGIAAFFTDPCSEVWKGSGVRTEGLRCRDVLDPQAAAFRYFGMVTGYAGALTGLLLLPFGIYYVAAGRRPRGYGLLVGTTLLMVILFFAAVFLRGVS
jgi:hypothetical protein